MFKTKIMGRSIIYGPRPAIYVRPGFIPRSRQIFFKKHRRKFQNNFEKKNENEWLREDKIQVAVSRGGCNL